MEIHGIFGYDKGLPDSSAGRWKGLASVEAGEVLGRLECHIQEFGEGKPCAKSQERAASQ